MKVIDSSARLCCRNGQMDVDDFLRQIDRAQIDRAVIAPSDEFVAAYNEEGSLQILQFVKRHPDRISGMAAVNPWYGAKARDILSRCFDRGMVGLYLNPGRQGFMLTEAVVDPLIETCIRYDRTIYSYTGTPVFAMPFQLAELARRFPAARFIMGHSAWTDFSGYDVIPSAKQAPNVFVDTSCTNAEMVKGSIVALGAERVVFCSAYPKSRPSLEIEKIRGLGLPPVEFERIVRGNAERLWGIRA